MRVHLVWSVCQYRSLYGPRDTDLLRHIAVQHHILIPLSLIVVLPVISSAVFLSVGPSPIAVGFGLSIELLRRGFSFPMVVEAAVGRERREKKLGSTRS